MKGQTIKNIFIVESELKEIANQNVKCELKEFTLNINLEFKPTDEIMKNINDYIYNNIQVWMKTKINY